MSRPDESVVFASLDEALLHFDVQLTTFRQLTAYIANVPAIQLQFIRLGAHWLPLLINSGSCDSCYVVSAKAQYIDYALAEVAGLKNGLIRRLLAGLGMILPGLARAVHLDRLVVIGGWLLPTNPALNLTDGQLMALMSFLKQHYPTHAFIAKNMDALLQETKLVQLEKQGFIRQINREIHWFDPRLPLTKKHRQNIQRDLAMLDHTGYTINDEINLNEADIFRMHQLYTGLYLEKHSTLNAGYTPAWFKLLLHNQLMSVRCIREADGNLIGFVMYYRSDGVIHPQIVGYDITRTTNQSPYRPLVASLIQDARQTNQLLFLSSGVAKFKKNRGTRTYYEYDAIYYAHLRVGNRMLWKLLHVLYQKFAVAVYSEDII